MEETLLVPHYARLMDYAGPWSLHPVQMSLLNKLVDTGEIFAFAASSNDEPLKSAMTLRAIPGGKAVAVINLDGVLMKGQSWWGTSTVQARRDIRQAVADPDVSGIMIKVHSPGGTVAGIFDLAADVRAANRAKPVFAHIEDMGASAAYHAVAWASRITLNSPDALVGSIGTFQVLNDLSAMAEREGVRTILVATGPLKGMGTPGTKITDDQVNHVQGLVHAAQGIFDIAVRQGRNMNAKELENVRHGGVFIGQEAVNAKLVDAVQSEDKSMKELVQAVATRGGARAEARDVLPMRYDVLPVMQSQWDATRRTSLGPSREAAAIDGSRNRE